MGAAEWGEALINGIIDWGLPKAVIMDRDPKWINKLWKAVFKSLSIKFLATTAWHPQSDGQSERTNQTIEIALRLFLLTHPEKSWVKFLPFLRAMINNYTNTSTGKSPNQLCYGHNTFDQLTILAEDTNPDLHDRTVFRQEAADAIAFANITSKIRYDLTHKPINMRVGDEAYIRLHHGYRLPGIHKKLGLQRVAPFKVLERIGTLAYRLQLPGNWTKVHPVISIAMLEPKPKGKDPYDRDETLNPQEPVADGYIDSEYPTWEIDALVNRRWRAYGKAKQPREEFYVKWKGHGPQHNTWYGLHDLKDAMEYVIEARKRYPRPEDTNALPQFQKDADEWEDLEDDQGNQPSIHIPPPTEPAQREQPVLPTAPHTSTPIPQPSGPDVTIQNPAVPAIVVTLPQEDITADINDAITLDMSTGR